VISFERLLAFWPIPVFYIVFTLISWILCQTVIPIFGIDKYYKRFVLACVMFCNTNSLPIAIISSLAVSEAGKTLFWGPDDTQEMVSARYVTIILIRVSYIIINPDYSYINYSGISYTLFFGLFCNILRWSYGYNLLQRKAEDNDTIVNDGEDHESSIMADYGSNKNIDNDDSRRSSSATISEIDSEYSSSNNNKQVLPNETTRLLLSSSSLPQYQLQEKEKTILEHFKQIFVSIDKYMSPPLYAAFLALFVGLYPPLKHLMYDKDSFFHASITKAIESCGKASVPINLVSLGAQLKSIRDTQQTSTNATNKSKKPISVSIMVRMFLTPLCVLPIVFAFATFGQRWSELANDPMFIVSMIVVGCTPTAINLSQITQVSGIFEEEILNVLFWSYGVICIPVCTFVVFLALLMVGSMN
jgi:predicted permease